MKIAILALQGAFEEHRQMLLQLGVESVFIRNLTILWAKSKAKSKTGCLFLGPAPA